MLRLEEISKTYRAGGLVQRALDGVSLCLRDSEFVAILGPSGSGKTTLLNVIGGLDRYDGGDLVIDGVSTRRYNARDWDAYRNHTVGFVFQSYNLIPHQTILKNVELALTISGVPRREKTRRAQQALERVGLGEQARKKPSQLSGGQMQRVAIARALVNDPKILLADEPTGALDSDTSVQVMDLLQEVAKDRLVVMVTHNPELAERYATRVVRLRDGVIQEDSDPFQPQEAPGEGAPVHRRMGRASMSFLTALGLSFNNLWTKKARTVLVAFAGSIGIIGIAMILSMSNGVDRYIRSVEEETLQTYPLEITDTSLNLSSLMAMGTVPAAGGGEEADEGVRELKTVTGLFSQVDANDLRSLRAYLEGEGSQVYDYARAIEYGYGLSPQIYAQRDGAVRQVNPDKSLSALGFSGGEAVSGLFSSLSGTDIFHPLPADGDLYQPQYDVLAGRWPQRWDECVLVLSSRGRVTDRTLYALGLRDPAELDEMIRALAEGGAAPAADEEERVYAYEDFLGIQFRLVGAYDLYAYDPDYQIWADRSDDEAFLRGLVEAGDALTLVGVVGPKEGTTSPLLTMGVGYPAELTSRLMERAAASPAVQAQLAQRGTDIFTGRRFGDQEDRRDLDLSALFTVDEAALREALAVAPGEAQLDLSALDFSDLDLTGLDLSSLDLGGAALSLPSLSAGDVAALLEGVTVRVSAQGVEDLFRQLLAGYQVAAGADPATDYAKLPQALEAYFNSPEAQGIVSEELGRALEEAAGNWITAERLGEAVEAVLAGLPAYAEAADPAEGPAQLWEGYLRSPAAQEALEAQAAALRDQAAAVLIGREELDRLAAALLEGYQAYAQENALPDLALLGESFSSYLESPEAQALLLERAAQAIDTSGLEQRAAQLFSQYSAALGGQLAQAMEGAMAALSDAVVASLRENLGGLAQRLSGDLMDAFQLDPQAMAQAFQTKLDAGQLRDLMASLLSKEESSYEGNLKKLGWADEEAPSSITIYPNDFDGKKAVKALLDEYNQLQEDAGAQEKVISYTDMVDTLMSSVSDIVNAISYVLIAFVAISLVVSSVMIGVITYISVLERQKEIGILRAIGASKGNVSQVFNAETFIIGALAGLFGVGITLILLIPANQLIRSLTGLPNLAAYLAPGSAVVLVLLSIALTLLGGIIPSQKAARSDPVTALRSE